MKRLLEQTACIHRQFTVCTFLLDSGEPCPGGTSREVEVELSKLRDVAWALDALSKLTKAVYEPIAAMDEVGAATLEVTVAVSRDTGEPMTPDEAKTILDWVASREMQEDLEAWAALGEGT